MDSIFTVRTSQIVLNEPLALPADHCFTSPEIAWKLLRQLLELEDTTQEHFFCIALNSANNLIVCKRLFTGGIGSVIVDPRIVFRYAILNGATSIIVAHNHPSGVLEPSIEDIRITGALKQAGTMIEVRVLDHIVFSNESYRSMAATGLMN